jgi:hypothetical protein
LNEVSPTGTRGQVINSPDSQCQISMLSAADIY